MIAATQHWARRNLFRTPFDATLSLFTIPLALWLIYSLIHWATVRANWDVIPDSLRVLLVGIFPVEMIARPWIATAILCLLSGATLGTLIVSRLRITLPVILIALLATLCLGLAGSSALAWIAVCGAAGLIGWQAVSSFRQVAKALLPLWLIGLATVAVVLAPGGVDHWGGLLLSVLITIVASIVSVPLGVLLAFGRKSRWLSLRVCCTAYIEIMRSIPLILVVYWVWIVMPLLAPEHNVPDVIRGMLGFSIFYAAYTAEYVRSGLQSVPRGQTEAAQSLGLSGLDSQYYIILPQALRVVVPALIGNVLDIFNTVPLIFIIGLTDFLRAGQMILINPQYNDRSQEVYVFLLVTYFIIGSLITFAARRLEAKLARSSR